MSNQTPRWNYFILAIAALVITKLSWMAMFHVNGDKLIKNQEQKDLLSRRAYLIAKVKEAHSIKELHGSLPPFIQGEWAVGTYSMLTAALANISFLIPQTREESLRIIEELLATIIKEKEFRQFDTKKWHNEDALESLQGPHGHLGYLGHLNFMLAAYHYLGGQNPTYKRLFSIVSEALIKKMSLNPTCQAETYPEQVFIADNAVAVASISLYERAIYAQSPPFSRRWLRHAKDQLLDHQTGLLVHRTTKEGPILEYTRGCTTGWNSFYLPFIDGPFAQEQYNLMKRNLEKNLFLGIKGIREFPRGISGNGDIDSGPIIFELSTSGTGFAVAGAKIHGDAKLLDSLLNTAEMIGSTFQWDGKRRYLLAPIVGDAIMLAMRTATPWDNRFQSMNKDPKGRI